MNKWEENIRKVVPYVPGEQPQEKNIIKLNTNENPYPPSPKVHEAHHTMDIDRFALYPDPAASELVKGLEAYYGLEEGQVFVGSVLMMCWHWLFLPFLIRTNRFFFLMSRIHFIRSGRMFTAFPMSARR